MPTVSCVRCPSCTVTVTPVDGDLRGCRCGATIIGRKPDGRLYIAGPEGIELVSMLLPYTVQLELPI